MVNLLTNVAQAIVGKGTIRVQAHADGRGIVCDVSDAGSGVPPENRDRIFDALFTTKPQGMGLGLAVSRALARANEGDLSVVESASGGAAFRLTLPVAATVRDPAVHTHTRALVPSTAS